MKGKEKMKEGTLRESVYGLINHGYEDSIIATQLGVTVDVVGILREEKKEK